ncbi:hypothetical protein B1222_00565 [Paenibacillus larvae subsp. pulvifaciens]|nr:hypothetical protein B1222_00565 [Paenibacillus larvae subsp. pulvifaciens]
MKKTGLPSRFCVEDQFRLVVYYANNPESNKKWWDFTEERKHYRETNGYPSDRLGQEKSSYHIFRVKVFIFCLKNMKRSQSAHRLLGF